MFNHVRECLCHIVPQGTLLSTHLLREYSSAYVKSTNKLEFQNGKYTDSYFLPFIYCIYLPCKLCCFFQEGDKAILLLTARYDR